MSRRKPCACALRRSFPHRVRRQRLSRAPDRRTAHDGQAAAAGKVKSSGQPFRFTPMNSRERRIIHLSLRNETDLRIESSGSGPYRGVIVYPAGMASLPEAPPPPFRPSRFGRPPEPPGLATRDRGRRPFGSRSRRHGQTWWQTAAASRTSSPLTRLKAPQRHHSRHSPRLRVAEGWA